MFYIDRADPLILDETVRTRVSDFDVDFLIEITTKKETIENIRISAFI